jgi:hypothetical protein
VTFRVLLHKARYEPIELPANIHELIDLMPEQLRTMVEDESTEESWVPGRDYIFDNMPALKTPMYDKHGELLERADKGSNASMEEETEEHLESRATSDTRVSTRSKRKEVC